MRDDGARGMMDDGVQEDVGPSAGAAPQLQIPTARGLTQRPDCCSPCKSSY